MRVLEKLKNVKILIIFEKKHEKASKFSHFHTFFFTFWKIAEKEKKKEEADVKNAEKNAKDEADKKSKKEGAVKIWATNCFWFFCWISIFVFVAVEKAIAKKKAIATAQLNEAKYKLEATTAVVKPNLCKCDKPSETELGGKYTCDISFSSSACGANQFCSSKHPFPASDLMQGCKDKAPEKPPPPPPPAKLLQIEGGPVDTTDAQMKFFETKEEYEQDLINRNIDADVTKTTADRAKQQFDNLPTAASKLIQIPDASDAQMKYFEAKDDYEQDLINRHIDEDVSKTTANRVKVQYDKLPTAASKLLQINQIPDTLTSNAHSAQTSYLEKKAEADQAVINRDASRELAENAQKYLHPVLGK